MEIISNAIQEYAERHTSHASSILEQIERDTYKLLPNHVMLSGHLQGRLLSMISKMISPKTILEIGTYTGYSALCLAEGLASGGKLITLDIDEKIKERVLGYFKQTDHASDIDYRIGDAKDIIPSLSMTFDLVFIDADKKNYITYYEMIVEKVPSGGYILADNVLWKGRVLNPKADKITQFMKAFNQHIDGDERVENILLPIRDGVMVMRKR